MHIRTILNQAAPTISFEFFPPKSAQGQEELFATISELRSLGPGYVSVTYGAGGSTRHLTHELVLRLVRATDLTIIPHLTCRGHTQKEVRLMLEQYQAAGVENVMCLRGDPPKSNQESEFHLESGDFKYAVDLVRFVRQHFPKMGIGVAGFPEGHPETANRLQEMDYLKAKVDAGADYICTQLFYENRDFYDFSERCLVSGITIPIIAGIMPVVSLKNMQRIAELAQGARFPARLLKSLVRVRDDESARRVGIHWATEQVRDLLDNNVRGIHLYTLNKSNATQTIYHNLGIESAHQLHPALLRL